MKDTTEGVYMLVCALKYFVKTKKDKAIPKVESKTVWTNPDTEQTTDYSFVPRKCSLSVSPPVPRKTQ